LPVPGGLSFGRRFEREQCLTPESVEPRAQRFESASVDRVQAAGSFGTCHDQTGVLQDPEVLGYGWPADVHAIGKFSDGTRALSQSFENEATRGIAERIEDALGMCGLH
jgi:hypothetical protein